MRRQVRGPAAKTKVQQSLILKVKLASWLDVTQTNPLAHIAEQAALHRAVQRSWAILSAVNLRKASFFVNDLWLLVGCKEKQP
ncbi:MAG: hypothetical protein AUJ04_06725 [Acidobacteria bacterium 13_1_40CM_3_55_6]|nr:MAG: hypothetical protein AUJ04_06725 [Acidobacteria bacterium 13_1_40CM_3_55_6]